MMNTSQVARQQQNSLLIYLCLIHQRSCKSRQCRATLVSNSHSSNSRDMLVNNNSHSCRDSNSQPTSSQVSSSSTPSNSNISSQVTSGSSRHQSMPKGSNNSLLSSPSRNLYQAISQWPSNKHPRLTLKVECTRLPNPGTSNLNNSSHNLRLLQALNGASLRLAINSLSHLTRCQLRCLCKLRCTHRPLTCPLRSCSKNLPLTPKQLP